MNPQSVQVRRYRNDKQFQKDAKRLAGDGWQVISTTSETRRSGCARIIMLGGIGALVFRPKPQTVVTYSK